MWLLNLCLNPKYPKYTYITSLLKGGYVLNNRTMFGNLDWKHCWESRLLRYYSSHS